MAATGVVLIAFLVFHLLGNLLDLFWTLVLGFASGRGRTLAGLRRSEGDGPTSPSVFPFSDGWPCSKPSPPSCFRL